ncbi:hypothetical protein HDU98_011701 [Podochytrium sp. JEL0797]|nr:hypothetical protein HDU98_011701 [Podochytrium sp. JEL0797]
MSSSSSSLPKNKWDNFKSGDSDDDEKNAPQAPKEAGLPKAKLITIPWDPLCEEVRWALTRHGVPFVEYAYPWPLHFSAALEHSDPMPHKQQTQVPIFINYKNEVYKRSTSDIFMFLYAHSFNTSLKVYSEPHALVLQQSYGTRLAPAATTILLHTLLSSPHLTQKYLLTSTHLATHRALLETSWPILKPLMSWWFSLSAHSVTTAWEVVNQVFEQVEQDLARHDGKYIASKSFTAADIAFASHAAFVLFLNADDDGETVGTGFGFSGPCLKEIPVGVKENVDKLRQSVAGKHALAMYRKERVYKTHPDGYRSFPSKYSKENNPWWSLNNGRPLSNYILTFSFAYVLIWACVLYRSYLTTTLQPAILFLIFQTGMLVLGYMHFVAPNPVWSHKVKQVLFMVRGKFELTQRDRVELAEEEKERREGGGKEGRVELEQNLYELRLTRFTKRFNGLQELNLSKNQLTGAIPQSIANLRCLKDLWLLSNQISGEIPPELSALVSLEHFNLSDNRELSGPLPPQLGLLKKLKQLCIFKTNVMGSVPSEWGGLCQLQGLNLDNPLAFLEQFLPRLENYQIS